MALATVPGQPRQLILDEDDVTEDPFRDRRHGLAPGEVPTMTYTEPGMQITTIEVPCMADKKIWENLMHMLQVSTGIIVIRTLGQLVWDKDLYMVMSEVMGEICEIVDSRPTFIVNIAKGDVRSWQMAFAAFADVCLAEPDATFGFPEVRMGGLPAAVTVAMRKRVSDDNIRKMITDGLPLNAREAQRIGLVDFVGDVEAELSRIIFKNCKPKVTNVMYRPDCEKAGKLADSMGYA
eukprot:TRINITY_DN84573_c0_g1_i1.p1 TRINITY_DN84573_c0_g1~~TRINITY_DN84573_c0_g1_i1.p1  ORF type:complete len:236 (+),score=52.70 TRINITY_DN84573_c0_g1_i1:71-778(+)